MYTYTYTCSLILKEDCRRRTTSIGTVLDIKQSFTVKTRYKQNLLETFYIVTNSFTLYLDSNPQTIINR